MSPRPAQPSLGALTEKPRPNSPATPAWKGARRQNLEWKKKGIDNTPLAKPLTYHRYSNSRINGLPILLRTIAGRMHDKLNKFPYLADRKINDSVAPGLEGASGSGATAGHQGWLSQEEKEKVEVHLCLCPAVRIKSSGRSAPWVGLSAPSSEPKPGRVGRGHGAGFRDSRQECAVV
jgi:hypothetical protein